MSEVPPFMSFPSSGTLLTFPRQSPRPCLASPCFKSSNSFSAFATYVRHAPTNHEVGTPAGIRLAWKISTHRNSFLRYEVGTWNAVKSLASQPDRRRLWARQATCDQCCISFLHRFSAVKPNASLPARLLEVLTNPRTNKPQLVGLLLYYSRLRPAATVVALMHGMAAADTLTSLVKLPLPEPHPWILGAYIKDIHPVS
jgi:hypothetical protein